VGERLVQGEKPSRAGPEQQDHKAEDEFGSTFFTAIPMARCLQCCQPFLTAPFGEQVVPHGWRAPDRR
jgi:hypothetical protein